MIYSPIQMAADLPENYEKHPRPFQFIKDVPTDWEDTRVLNGEVGDYVTFARKDRNSEDWYLGSVTDENARTLQVPLDFLDAGRSYTRADLSRRRRCRLAHATARDRDRGTRGDQRRYADPASRARRRPGDPLRGGVPIRPLCAFCARSDVSRE